MVILFLDNRTNSFHFLTKVLANGLVVHYNIMQVYSVVSNTF